MKIDCDICISILNEPFFISRRGKKGERQRQLNYIKTVHEAEHKTRHNIREGGYTNDSVAT